MLKADVVKRVAETANYEEKEIDKIISILFDVIAETMKKGEKVQFVGFGSFKVKDRSARKGKNPITGDSIFIEGYRAPVFKAGKKLKDRIR